MIHQTNKMLGDFSTKPSTGAFAAQIEAYVMSLGAVKKEIKSQASYSVNRKFLWLWTYEKTSDGTLFLSVTLDHHLDDPHFHAVTQTSTNRWNHSVVVKDCEAATSPWLKNLILEGYKSACR